MAKGYLEASRHPFSPRYGRHSFLTIPRQDSNDVCGNAPHNQPYWVRYMDNPELSCTPGLDDDGGYITFRTGKNTKIDTKQACSLITNDPKDQKACIKKLNRGILPGLDGQNGEATIYLNDNQTISFQKDGLFTDAPEYETMTVANAIASANYTQREPDMTTIKIRNTIKENPIITDLSIGVLAFAAIVTLVNATYMSIKSRIAKKYEHKRYLKPVPLLNKNDGEVQQPRRANKPSLNKTELSIPNSNEDYITHPTYFRKTPKHSKNRQVIED